MDWGFSIEADLFGIVSPVKEYKLALRLNHTLEWELEKQPDIIVLYKRKTPILISNFIYSSSSTTIRLLKNLSHSEQPQKKTWLLPELKAFDFILFIQDHNERINFDLMATAISQTNEVQLITHVPLSNLKHTSHLIFE